MSIAVPHISAGRRRLAEGTLQPFERQHLQPVADLFARVFLQRAQGASDSLCRQFEEVFFEHPWQGLAVSPSMVYRDAAGEVAGFFGAHPRLLTVSGRRFSAVAVGQFMVDPRQRGRGIALALTEAILAGPQALTFTTSAAPAAARIFRRAGFWTPPFAGLRWQRRLQLPRALGRLPAARRVRRILAAVPLRRMLRRRSRSAAGWRCRALSDPATWQALRCDRGWGTMHFVMTGAQLDWLWQRLQQHHRGRRLRITVIEDGAGVSQAWVVDRVSASGHAKILEFCSRSPDWVTPLTVFLRAAEEAGVASVRGGCHTPELTVAAAECAARLVYTTPATAFFTHQRPLQQAVLNGSAAYSDLDGESWLRFQ